MIEKKNYMAIVASLIILMVYYMAEMYYSKSYTKGTIGYNNFSPIAIIYGIIVIVFFISDIIKAKKNNDKKSEKLGKRVLLLTVGFYILGKFIVWYSEKDIGTISDSMRSTDFSICQVFRIIINSIVISYIISSSLKQKEKNNKDLTDK